MSADEATTSHRAYELELLDAAVQGWERWNVPPRSAKQVEKLELDGSFPATELVFHAITHLHPLRAGGAVKTQRHVARFPIWRTENRIGPFKVTLPDGQRWPSPSNLAGILIIWFAEGSYEPEDPPPELS